jgi:hypothetical protein
VHSAESNQMREDGRRVCTGEILPNAPENKATEVLSPRYNMTAATTIRKINLKIKQASFGE